MAERTPPLLAVDDALARMAAALTPMGVETIALNDALGGVLAAPVDALLDHPPGDVSAMDGYAARAADLTALPTRLEQVGESAAGHPYSGTIAPGQCIRILTGAPCPASADTIILQEDTDTDGAIITIHEAPEAGRFIRPKGQDFSRGQGLFEAGAVINARNLALIGAAGHGHVVVRKRPVVAIISTGDELVEPGTPPAPGQIVSSNGVFLTHLVAASGGIPMPLGIVPDNEAALDAALAEAMAADLIITSGGASVGAHDGVARKMQAESGLAFWRIAMRPGKPLLFGHLESGDRLESGDDGKNPGRGQGRGQGRRQGRRVPLLGLPGNPVSTGVCGLIFGVAAMKCLLGQNHLPAYAHAVLAEPLGANDRRQDFLRARLHHGTDGRLVAHAFAKQDSAMLSVFAEADGLIMRPPHAPAAKAGAIVPILRIPDPL